MRIAVSHDDVERETYYPLPEFWVGDIDRFIADACRELDRMIREVVGQAAITPAVTKTLEQRRNEWLHTHVGEPMPKELQRAEVPEVTEETGKNAPSSP